MIPKSDEERENLIGRKPMEVLILPEINPFGLHKETAGVLG